MSGWVKLHRQILDHYLWKEKPFDRKAAWIDLVLIANHKDGKIRRRGILVNVLRGEVGYSLRELANRWGWSLGKVQRFFDELKSDNQIGIRTDTENVTVTSLICLVNYEKYQSGDTENDTETGTETIRRRVQNKNVKNEKNKFSPPSLDEVRAYCQERNSGVDPEAWVNHYAAKGWMIGKAPMKDWRAAVRTWEKSSTPQAPTQSGGHPSWY